MRTVFFGNHTLGIRSLQALSRLAEVVGVVADIRYQGLDSEPKKQVYEPLSQNSVNSMALVARTERDPSSLAGTLQREIWAVDAQ